MLSHFSHVQLCHCMDCSPPDSSVHEILQARILEWVAIPSSRGSSQPRVQTCVSCIAGRFFTHWATWEAQIENILVNKASHNKFQKTKSWRMHGEPSSQLSWKSVEKMTWKPLHLEINTFVNNIDQSRKHDRTEEIFANQNVCVCSVVLDCLWPRGLNTTRLLYPSKCVAAANAIHRNKSTWGSNVKEEGIKIN